MKILFVAPDTVETATARYRCCHLAEALREHGHSVDIASAEDDTVVVGHDIVVLHRLRRIGAGARIAQAARALGATVLYSTDDLIFEAEYAYQVGLLHPNDPLRYPYHRAEVEDYRGLMATCDGVLVSTNFLADWAKRAVGDAVPVRVVRNFLGKELRTQSEAALARRDNFQRYREDDRVVLGYLSGSPTHDADFQEIAGVLAGVLSAHVNTALFVVGPVALPERLLPFAADGRVWRHPFVPWRDLPGLLAGIDINLAPLEASRPFNHAKSEVKWLEAGALGVPTLASWATGFAEAVGPGWIGEADWDGWVSGFADGAHPEQTCLLARSMPEWQQALTRLVTQADLRRSLGKAAQKAILREKAEDEAQRDVIAQTFAEFAPRSEVTGSFTVRRPARERAVRSAWDFADKWYLRQRRFARHFRLLREQVEPEG